MEGKPMHIAVLTALKEYCLAKKGARPDHPFGPQPLVIKVGSKMFALLGISNGVAFISLKCDPFLAESLRQQYPAVKPGYYLNKTHWNTIHIDGTISEEELKSMIDHSYELVYKKLTRAEKEALDAADAVPADEPTHGSADHE